MPTYKQGNMWTVLDDVDHFIITTNAIIKANGEVVMGAGIAKQMRDEHPGSAKAYGDAIRQAKDLNDVYGCVLNIGDTICGAFQVKYHWSDQASLDLIHYSTTWLYNYALAHPDESIALNFPGIGNGGLPFDKVKQLVDQLPDNVQVWTFK